MDLETHEIDKKLENIEKYEEYLIKMEDRIETLEEFKKESMVIFKGLDKFIKKIEG